MTSPHTPETATDELDARLFAAGLEIGQASFPQEKLTWLMDEARNEVPLIWLADKRGYELVPLETELQRQLRNERESNERLAQENALLRGLITKAA